MPNTKQIASNMLDLPLPFNPVIAVNERSNGNTLVNYAYDLKPSNNISSKYIYKNWSGLLISKL